MVRLNKFIINKIMKDVIHVHCTHFNFICVILEDAHIYYNFYKLIKKIQSNLKYVKSGYRY